MSRTAALDGFQHHICLIEGLTVSLRTANGPPAEGSMGSAPCFEPFPPGFGPVRQRSGSVEHGQAGAKGGRGRSSPEPVPIAARFRAAAAGGGSAGGRRSRSRGRRRPGRSPRPRSGRAADQAHAIEPGGGRLLMAAEHVEVSDQPQRIASAAQRSRKIPAASMIRCHRSGEKPVGGGIAESAAKPSAHACGVIARAFCRQLSELSAIIARPLGAACPLPHPSL